MATGNLIHITETSNFKEVNSGKNKIIHSELNRFHKHYEKSQLSVKMVLSGVERYTVNEDRIDLKSGEFLVVNAQQSLNISFKEERKAEGFCFYIDENYLDQLYTLSVKGDSHVLNNPKEASQNALFLGVKHRANSCDFGNNLLLLAQRIKQNPNLNFSDDFFIEFASLLFNHQRGFFHDLSQLGGVKLSTRKELYSRVMTARDYIEQQPLDQKINIQMIARISAMSEVQLHRSFKSVFGITPHQYILKKRMTHAIEMIQSNAYTLSEIATLLGFQDLASFSKAFKKRLGTNPSSFRNSI